MGDFFTATSNKQTTERIFVFHVMSVFKDTIKRQILDENKRMWTADNDTGGNLDRFQIEVLEPLRDFESEGCFRLTEHLGSLRGSKRVNRVEITGEVNFPED